MGDNAPSHKQQPELDTHQLQSNNGSCLADYEIIKAIGKGKFSVVYRARRKSDDVLCALKKIAIFDMMDQKARDKCLKEVRILQNLSHPNIVKYLDWFIEGNELIILFEWAEAGDLKRQVRKALEKKARFDERVIWKYFAQIADAIHHMHERRIMHRDLKPANIFLTLSGCVKVGDLGLGRLFSENTMEAHTKVGTPLYMSPEVLRGNGYDWKSDIWSLGCVLYELAMLRSPFKSEGLNLYGLFQKISKGDFEPLPDHYSSHLCNLTYRMISVNPDDRPGIEEVCRIAKEGRERTAAQARNAAAQQQQRGKKPASHGHEGGGGAPQRAMESNRFNLKDDPIVAMDGILDRLKVLQYEKELVYCERPVISAPFSKDHFAYAKKHVDQFHDFGTISEWLVRMMGGKSLWAPEEKQNSRSLVGSTTTASRILLRLQEVGLSPTDAASIPPSSLASGHGAAVCSVLKWLLDKVLVKVAYEFKSPVHVADEGEFVDSIQAEDFEGSVAGTFLKHGSKFPVTAEELRDESGVEDDDDAIQPILKPVVEPELWAQEFERVMPLLKEKMKEFKMERKMEWTSRLDHIQSSLEVYSDSGLKGLNDPEKRNEQVCKSIGMVRDRIVEDVERISSKEDQINKAFAGHRKTYQAVQSKSQDALEKHGENQKIIEAKMQKLAELNEKIGNAKSVVADRDASVTDATPLHNIKKALKALKEETALLEMQLGLTSSNIMRCQQKKVNTRGESND